MKLAAFFDAIGPMLTGAATAEQTAIRLDLLEPDRSRLAIYARFCRRHRFEVIEPIFSCCHASVVRELGEQAWETLVEAYFRRHPMRHVELGANGALWPEFLAGEFLAEEQPVALPWLASLADFEHWEHLTLTAPDAPDLPEASTGPLRLAPTLELRPYPYDFVDWFDRESEGKPPRRDVLVLFWRDAVLAGRRENAEEVELLVLKSIATGTRLTEAMLAAAGVTARDVEETTSDLVTAGILHGAATISLASR